MLAYYVHHLNPFIVQFTSGFGIRWYGAAYVLGFLGGYWLLCWMARKGFSELSAPQMAEVVTGACLWGVLAGGRLGYVLFYDFQEFLRDPLLVVRFWDGGITGMSSHGGILGLFLFTLWYAWRHKVSWPALGDNIVVAAPIGIFFGRCANFINGELFGRPAVVPHWASGSWFENLWAMQFPKELLDIEALPGALADKLWLGIHRCWEIDPSLNNSVQAVVDASRTSPQIREVLSHYLTPRYPSQLYEAAMEGVLLFAALWFLRTRTRVPQGVVCGAFFLIYALVRIFGEQFRQPDAGIAFTLGLTRGQFLSLFMILIGFGFVIVGFWRNKPSPRPEG